jgi:Rieske 2Fe-2S family protein
MSHEVVLGDIGAVFEEVTRARHAPGALYSDPRVLELEIERIFMRDWFCLARIEELAAPGEFLTARVGREPVLLCRDEAGAVRAYLNMCRHRGVEVAAGRGSARQFVCPYHGWTYDLDGRLRGAGFMQDAVGFERRDCRLQELGLGVWAGWIFVTLNPQPEPFESYIADFEEKFGYLRMESLRLGLRIETELKCNWKLMVENFIDFYHINVLHRDTVARFMKTVDLPYELRRNGQVFINEYDTGTLSKSGEQTARRIAALEDRPARFSQTALLPPNLNFFVRPDYVSLYTSWPLTVDTMRMSAMVLWTAETLASPSHAAIVAEFRGMLDKVLAEDFSMVESLQNALGARSHAPGRMCHLERGVQHFIKHSLERLGARIPGEGGSTP